MNDVVQQKLDALPAKPGVYLFKDKKGAVVYVGKAKSLRCARAELLPGPARATSGTSSRSCSATIGDLETIVTATEKEAPILENSLIKEHQPRYNVKLRDDKDFLCAAPRRRDDATGRGSRSVRRPTPDGARYFGPYHSATAARRTLHLVNKHFQLRTCSDAELAVAAGGRASSTRSSAARRRACCDVDKAWYAEQVRRGRDVPRRPPRRALARARRAG